MKKFGFNRQRAARWESRWRFWHQYLGKERKSAEREPRWQPRGNSKGVRCYADGMKGSFFGPHDSVEDIEQFNSLYYDIIEAFHRRTGCLFDRQHEF